MPAIIAAANEQLSHARFPAIFAGGRRVSYEMDNASCHGQAGDFGLDYENAMTYHPPRSPDFNRVVENTHHIICSRFAKEIQRRAYVDTPGGYTELFRMVAMGDPRVGEPCVTVEATRRNFEGLPELWVWVYDHFGVRAPKNLSH